MPSDPRTVQALDALAGPIDAFRSTLSNTSEQIRLLISTRVERNGTSTDVARAELGEFAAGRIDAERMAALVNKVEPAAIEHGEVVARALEVCRELLAMRENLFRVEVDARDDLRAAVGRALAQIGRAFAVTRIVELVTQGQYRAADHAALLDAHPFEHWSRAERDVDLGLVVCVAGQDLRVAGLADILDRGVKLVLLVHDEAPPAPLVRLITPETLVIQATDATELEWITRNDGPCVLALMPESSARFRHDPTGGASLADRIVITHLPEKGPRRIGITSAFQQQQELAQLEALAAAAELAEPVREEAPAPETTTAPASAAAPAAPAAAAAATQTPGPAPAVDAPADARAQNTAPDAVDRLSEWLLAQADLPGAS